MKRTVSHDGAGSLEIRFPYERSLVERIKGLPRRRWNATERVWVVPDTDAVAVIDLLRPEGFRFDVASRALYRERGGSAALDGDDEPAAPLLPGLFDTADAAPAAATPGDYTVSGLNERVGELIEGAFPTPVWLVGEIAGFNKSAHRKHVSFELAERAEDGRTLSKIPATLFESTRREIEAALAAAGDPFRLEDEITVRCAVRVELYVPWGQYRAVVERLDVRYTLGEAARRREEIVGRLAAAGLLGRNDALPLPPTPLRVALVTSLGSDACNDVLRTLEESGYAFRVAVHGARVQGHGTEPSVLNALDWIRDRSGEFDAVLICRGGGSRTDLVWFDTEPLGTAVATFPLPVIVGIGHEQDLSVLDAVARSCKTPTAAAALLVQTVRDAEQAIEGAGAAVLRGAARVLAEERATQRRRAVRLPRAVALGLDRHRLRLAAVTRALVQAARRDVRGARRRVGELAAALGPRGLRGLSRAAQRLEERGRRLHLVDPRRTLDRGFAILRGEDGGVVRSSGAAPAGRLVRAELSDGVLRLRSEGAEEMRGG